VTIGDPIQSTRAFRSCSEENPYCSRRYERAGYPRRLHRTSLARTKAASKRAQRAGTFKMIADRFDDRTFANMEVALERLLAFVRLFRCGQY
jgi:hypothetical protein